MLLSWLCGAALAGEPTPYTPPPGTLGAMVVKADSGAELRLRFAAQLLVQNDIASAAPTVSARVRRLRAGLEGRALDGRLRSGLQVNLAPGATETLDLWAELEATEGVNLRVGMFKTPFTRYRDQSYSNLLLSDWPLASKTFGAERQLGLALHDGRPGHDRLGWSLGVFTGQNSRKAFATGVADAYGQVLTNPSDWATGTTTTTLHPELMGRLTFGTPKLDATTGYDFEGGGPRVLVGLSGAYDLRPNPLTEFVGRGAAEFLIKAHHVSLGGVGYLGLYEDAEGVPQPGLAGVTGELSWLPDPRLGLALSYSRVDELASLRADARGWADAQIAAAPTEEQEALTETLAAVGTQQNSSELMGGATWFVHGTGLNFQVDGAWLHSSSTLGEKDSARVRLQTQIVF